MLYTNYRMSDDKEKSKKVTLKCNNVAVVLLFLWKL